VTIVAVRGRVPHLNRLPSRKGESRDSEASPSSRVPSQGGYLFEYHLRAVNKAERTSPRRLTLEKEKTDPAWKVSRIDGSRGGSRSAYLLLRKGPVQQRRAQRLFHSGAVAVKNIRRRETGPASLGGDTDTEDAKSIKNKQGHPCREDDNAVCEHL